MTTSMNREQISGTGTKKMAPSERAFARVHALLKQSFRHEWEFPRILLDVLNEPQKTASVGELCALARDSADLGDSHQLSDKIFLAAVRHAAAQIRRSAFRLFRDATNEECITLSLPSESDSMDERIEWRLEPERMRQLLSSKSNNAATPA